MQAHANLGGTFIIATPALIYSGCILRTVKDVTSSSEAIPQRSWSWDFEQPLVTETGAEQAVNSFLSKIDGGTKMTDASWTNTVAALGNTSLGGAVSGVASSIVGLVGKLSGTFGL